MLLLIGGVLCAVVATAYADRWISSRIALHTYAAAYAEPSGTGKVSGEPQVDFSLWSQKRITAYKDLLTKPFAAPIGILKIPKFGIEVPIFDGTTELQLNRGAGRIVGTARPGSEGNMGIAAHRDGFFRGLKDIAVGDAVTLLHSGSEWSYEVEDIEIVNPDDISVLNPRAKPSVTLVTCYPFYFAGDAPKRYIVHCSLKQRSSAEPTAQ